MAHPKLIGRVDRRALMAAGTAALLLGAPAAASGAPLGDAPEGVDCTAEDALEGRCEETAAASQAVEPVTDTAAPVTDEAEPVTEEAAPVTEAVQAATDAAKVATDPVEKIVDDIVTEAPAPVPPPADVAPDVAPGVAPDGAPDALPAPRPDMQPGASTPDGGAVSGTPSVGAAGGPPLAGVPRTTGVNTTGGFQLGDPVAANPSSSFTPLTPVVSSPFAGNLPKLAEEFISSSREPLTAGAEALTAPLSGMNTPAPDASSWLLATAGGLLLLMGAGHLAHARQRFAASVAQ